MPEPDPGEKPTVVIDLDGTILERNLVESLRLYLYPSPRTGRIMPAAAAALHRLAGRARIVAVTARCVRGQGNTERWLARMGLDFIPSIHSPRFLAREPSRVVFKIGVIQGLAAGGARLRFGVGDRGSDLAAYLDTGLFPVMVSSRPGKRLDSVLALARERNLGEGRDYLLFRREEGAPPLWDRVAASIEERI